VRAQKYILLSGSGIVIKFQGFGGQEVKFVELITRLVTLTLWLESLLPIWRIKISTQCYTMTYATVTRQFTRNWRCKKIYTHYDWNKNVSWFCRHKINNSGSNFSNCWDLQNTKFDESILWVFFIYAKNAYLQSFNAKIYIKKIFLDLILCAVLFCIFTFWVPRCDVCYDFRINTMVCSSIPPVDCRMAHVLFT
jgi:hypothetical protein